MHKFPANHHVLVRSLAQLDARDPSPINLPLPNTVNSIPLVGPLVSPLVGNGASGAQPSSTPPNPQPAPISTAGGGGGGGNGGGTGGSTPTPTDTPSSGGGTAVPPVSVVSSPTSPTSASGKSSSSSSTQNASGGGSTARSSSSAGGANYVATSGGQIVPVNVGTSSAALGTLPATALATGFLSPSQSSLGSSSNTVGTVVPLPTTTTAAATSSGKQLSGDMIAGITVVCLFFLLALILLVVRRRSIARRVELRRQWWFTRTASGGNSNNPRSSVGSDGELPTSRLSARSSFATNFDQGLTFRVDSPSRFSLTVVPDLPPMAEVRERNSVLISTGAAVARRESMNSMLSNGSDPDAQYLSFSPGQNNLEPSTPMFVRPFSPSESFAFPKPPAPSSSTMDAFFISGTHGLASSRSSGTTLIQLSTPPRAFMTDLPPGPAKTPALYPQTSMPSVPFSPFIAEADPSLDPFTDPVKPEFANVQVIYRHFTPALDDELAVHPGDRICVLQIFDDGWSFVEKLAGTEGGPHERGLIPVDCLREAGQTIPTFLAQKRINSYVSDHLIDSAL